MESITTLTAGMDVKQNVSPQPTIRVSVVTLTISESTVCRSAPHHAPASDRPPAVTGIRSGMDSMLAIFMIFVS